MHRTNYRYLALASLVATTITACGSSKDNNADDVAVRIAPVARVQMAPQQTNKAPAGARTGEEMYKAICFACHAPGAAIPTSPKLGDKAAWAPRLALGLDGLTKSAIAGKNAMPPKGGATDATEAEISRAIVYMTNQSGANF